MRRQSAAKHLFTALFLVCALLVGLAGCSSSSSIKYVVYHVEPLLQLTNGSDSYDEYNIVYYEENASDDSSFEIVKHQNEPLTGLTYEIHFYEDQGWTVDDVQSYADDAYGAVDSMDFATRSINSTDGVICLLVKFTDLDNTKNAQAMVDADYIELTDDTTEVSGAFSAGYFMQNIDMTGGTELSDEEVEKLGLHFK